MDDLISRNITIETIWNLYNRYGNNGIDFDVEDTKAINRFCSMLQREIEMQDTAYDPDKVVEQLYELGGVDGFDDCAKAYDRAIEDSIKVVKAGGLNE